MATKKSINQLEANTAGDTTSADLVCFDAVDSTPAVTVHHIRSPRPL
jgi:hypothetical protein